MSWTDDIVRRKKEYEDFLKEAHDCVARLISGVRKVGLEAETHFDTEK